LKYREVTYQNHPEEGIAIKDEIISNWFVFKYLVYVRMERIAVAGTTIAPLITRASLASEFTPTNQSSFLPGMYKPSIIPKSATS
jgi:hypothetical protein